MSVVTDDDLRSIDSRSCSSPSFQQFSDRPIVVDDVVEQEIMRRVSIEVLRRMEHIELDIVDEVERRLRQIESSTLEKLLSNWEGVEKQKMSSFEEIRIKQKTVAQQLLEKTKELNEQQLLLEKAHDELARDKKRLAWEMEEIKEEASIKIRQTIEEANHRAQLDKSLLNEVVKTKEQLVKDLKQAQESLVVYENKFERFKDQYGPDQIAICNAKIASHQANIEDHGNKMKTVLEERDHYKAHWVRALQEIERLQRQHHDELNRQVQKQRNEISSLQVVAATAQQTEALESEKSDLSTLKSDIQELEKELQSQPSMESLVVEASPDTEPVLPQTPPPQPIEPPHPISTTGNGNDVLFRLLGEKEILMRSGSYQESDPVIIELNKYIEGSVM